ncbi:MAG: DUF4358 domain-containing protein [Butyricicoccus pullicaecorum]|nr:DUF4358 domain-containing protein [Butyricicoccus pullicaecorum]MDO4668650.1 DUF4358 domain-containing protein [Butyricicoccus pullicaecorum]
MKKRLLVCVALMVAGLLTACGGGKDQQTASADLQGFYQNLEQEYEWGEGYMVEIDEEMLDAYFPGLRDIPKKQLVARTPMMSAVANELVFIETENEADADKAAEILRARIKAQADGGAWYPESIEVWKKGEVIQKGNYVAMIVAGENQDKMKAGFEELIA